MVEAELDKYRGVTATLLVQNGTLRRGDTLVVGKTWGRIKAMFDYEGKPLQEAAPSTPTVVLGLQEVPNAGDVFERVMNDKEARRIAEERKLAANVASQQPPRPTMSLEDFFARMEGGETKTLNLIVRADMQGTLEPVVNSLNELGNDEVELKILQASIGDISESDVMLAEASEAVIIGFSVGVDKSAQVRAEQSGVEIRHYDIIYKMIEDIEDALKGMLEPIYKDIVVGHATVLQLFKLRKGVVAGCMVNDGYVKRGALATCAAWRPGNRRRVRASRRCAASPKMWPKCAPATNAASTSARPTPCSRKATSSSLARSSAYGRGTRSGDQSIGAHGLA